MMPRQRLALRTGQVWTGCGSAAARRFG